METLVKVFDNVTSDTTKELNDWLKGKDFNQIEKITPLYNTILGGIIYVVQFLK